MTTGVFEREEKSVSARRKTASTRVDESSLPDLRFYFDRWLQDLRTQPPRQSKDLNERSRRAGLRFDGTLTVDGYVRGDLRSPQGTLIVAAAAEIDGDVSVETALVHGLVRGDITAHNVELGCTAEVIGHINASAFSVQAGAVFEGQSAYLSQPERRQSESIPSSSTPDAEDCRAKFAEELAVA